MSSKSKVRMFFLVSFIFSLSSLPAAYAVPPADACSLLTPAQVSAVLGVPAASKALGTKACIWAQTDAKPGSPRRRVDLVILIMQGYTQGYAVAKMPNSPTSATHVSGLGDDAYYLSMTSGEAMELRVKKGSVAVGIRVEPSGTPFTPDQIKDKEKTLAQDVLAKL